MSPWDGLRLPLGLPENRDGEGCAGRQVPGRGRLTLASLPPHPPNRRVKVSKCGEICTAQALLPGFDLLPDRMPYFETIPVGMSL